MTYVMSSPDRFIQFDFPKEKIFLHILPFYSWKAIYSSKWAYWKCLKDPHIRRQETIIDYIILSLWLLGIAIMTMCELHRFYRSFTLYLYFMGYTTSAMLQTWYILVQNCKMVFRMCYLYINCFSEFVHFRIISTANKCFHGYWNHRLSVCLSKWLLSSTPLRTDETKI